MGDFVSNEEEVRQRRIAHLRQEGRSLGEIADELGASNADVVRDLKAIEDRTGSPLDVEWFDAPELADLTADNRLRTALASLHQAQSALTAGGVRSETVPHLVAEIHDAAAQVTATNEALPGTPESP